MISTCVHCKKQFEWEIVPTASKYNRCLNVVVCCHCNRQCWISTDNIPIPVSTSKPLQVAKKWVVKKNELALCMDGMFGPNGRSRMVFDTMEVAGIALVEWIKKYGRVSESFRIEEVDA